MDSSAASMIRKVDARSEHGAGVTLVAVLVVLCCLGFAGANVVLMFTDRFASQRYLDYVAGYPVGFAVMNWLVLLLKAFGAGLAVLSITARSRLIRPPALAVLLWSAFATLALYALGSVVEAIGIVLGLMGSRDQINLGSVGYVLFFLLFAAGFGVLARAYSRRNSLKRRQAFLGVIVGPLALALILFGVPSVLAAFDLLPSS
jgi:hypothetical protein